MSLMRIILDEAWPVYGLSPATEADCDVVDIPDDLIERYKATEVAYNAVQSELEKIFNGHRCNRD